MTAVTLDTLTKTERADIEQLVADNRGHGWLPVDSAKKYGAGVHIRHIGQQWAEAYWHGTGVIVAVLKRNDEIELIVAYDKPRFEGGSRITQLGSYHVDLGPFEVLA
jgi:hypothetical protein